jgi:hypothetical protein
MIGIMVVPAVLFFREENDRRSGGRCLYTWLTECGATMAEGLFTGGGTTSLINQATGVVAAFTHAISFAA